MSQHERPGAGLTYAPPAQDFTEITEAGTNFDVRELAFYKEREAKKTFRARATLLAVIFVMLTANIILANRNHEHTMIQSSQLLENLDQTRLDQAQLTELVESRLAAIEVQIAAMDEAQSQDDEEDAGQVAE